MNARLLCFAALGWVACGDPTDATVETQNLERPVDVAFACHGGLRLTDGAPGAIDDPIIESAMPATACDIRSLPDPADTDVNVPVGQENLVEQGGLGLATVKSFALILQSAPGTVAVAEFPNKPSEDFGAGDVLINDSAPLIPGKNSVSVGHLPVAIATDRAGCHALTANAGSCDLSVVGLNSILQFQPEPDVRRRDVVNATGTVIEARPAAMLAEPARGTIGVTCPAEPEGVVFIAYPACHLVAVVEASTGTVVAGVQFAPDGTASIVDGNVSCPSECGGTGTITDGPRPVAMDLVNDERVGSQRLAIGADNVPGVYVVEMTNDWRPVSVSMVPLSGEVGVVDLSLSLVAGMGGEVGLVDDNDGPEAQYVYAVTTDGTVRVADVLNERVECDTQVDPRYLFDETNVTRLSCFPVGDAGTPPRRANARGPGIQLPGEAVPVGVRLIRAVPAAADTRSPQPSRLAGHFAVITASDGRVVIANMDDDDYFDAESSTAPLLVDLSMALAHQLRDSIPDRGRLAQTTNDANETVNLCDTNGPDPDGDANAGGPRVDSPPSRFINEAAVNGAKTFALPTVRAVECVGEDDRLAVSQLAYAAPAAVRQAAFPDTRGVRADEDWALTWEGALSGDTASTAVDGPVVRDGTVRVDGTGMALVDPSLPFCEIGAEPFDIAILRGCNATNGDADCGIGFTCHVHPDATVSAGACLPTDQVDFLSAPCRDFLLSVRRYSVATSAAGELELMERQRILRTTPLDGCASDTQCMDLAVEQARLASEAHPVDDTTAADDFDWVCEVDPSRAGDRSRCVMACETSADCDDGTVCNGAGRCVEGVVPPLQCVTGPQRYELRAGEAFTVLGDRTGYLHPWVAGSDGACELDPTASPLLRGRIPLIAPPCVGEGPTALTANPCTVAVDHVEAQTLYDVGTCDLAENSGQIVARPTTAIRFQNQAFSFDLVDPSYPGDGVCRGDRQGTRGQMATVFSGFTIAFRVVNGASPLGLGLNAVFPTRVVRGPQNSVWVMDEGDFVTNTASNRGRVYRVESTNPDTVNTLR